ncbi:MAG: glycosyltransferase family 2 protein [Bacteroidales bacterium]|nr:glycosyltransferase family 2 protein [Bacteroidales bacterium]
MDIAIVILNWNGRQMLQQYLPSLLRHTTMPGSFVVVADNGSEDGSVEWLHNNYPQLQIIELDHNYGFTGGYNRALKQIDADYYLLLNSDVEVTEGWIETLAAFMEEHPEVGICQPKLLSYTDKTRFEYAGAAGGFLDRFGYPFCRGRILGNIEKDYGQYDTPMEVFWASGAALMIRSALYHHLGGLDELFFAHMEEIDLCWRAKMLGYQVWAVPTAVVYHLGGGTLPNESPRKLYLNYRNNLLMLHKNLPKSVHFRVLTIRKALDWLSATVYLLTGKWSSFKAVCNAHKDYSKMKKEIDQSPFSDSRNRAGLFMGSIVFRYYLSGAKLTWKQIEKHL